jgi:hypothetical protein
MKSHFIAATFGLAVLAYPSPISQETDEKNATTVELEKRQLFGGGDISCGPVAAIYCKRTFEPSSNGIVVGNQFQSGLKAVLPSGSQFHAVDYTNGVIGYLSGGVADGITLMRKLAQDYVAKCPGIKLVMSGYRYAST